MIRKGRFGPYVQHGKTVANLPRDRGDGGGDAGAGGGLLAEKGKELKPLVKGKGRKPAKAAKSNGAAAAGRHRRSRRRARRRPPSSRRQEAGGQEGRAEEAGGEAPRSEGRGEEGRRAAGQGRGLRCRGARPAPRRPARRPGRCSRRRSCGASSAPRRARSARARSPGISASAPSSGPRCGDAEGAAGRRPPCPPASAASAAPGRLPEHGGRRGHRHRSGWRSAGPAGRMEAGTGRAAADLMRPERAGRPALAPGERVLARLKPIGRRQVRGPHRQAGRRSRRPARVLGVSRGRPDRPDRPPAPRRNGWSPRRGRRRRSPARSSWPSPCPAPPLGPEAGPHHRAAGRDGGAAFGLADRASNPWHPHRLPGRRRWPRPKRATRRRR